MTDDLMGSGRDRDTTFRRVFLRLAVGEAYTMDEIVPKDL